MSIFWLPPIFSPLLCKKCLPLSDFHLYHPLELGLVLPHHYQVQMLWRQNNYWIFYISLEHQWQLYRCPTVRKIGDSRVLVPGHQNSGAPYLPDWLSNFSTSFYRHLFQFLFWKYHPCMTMLHSRPLPTQDWNHPFYVFIFVWIKHRKSDTQSILNGKRSQ